MTSWADHAILWQVYPLGLTGAEPAALPSGVPVRHRLPLLEGWLDYAVELGCSGLLLGPVFAASTHGYDTVDHFRIDPRLGDEQDFASLIAACSGRGLRIVTLTARGWGVTDGEGGTKVIWAEIPIS